MPELPEVETIARGLNKRVSGDRIESVWIGNKPEPLKSSAAEIANTLEGSRVDRVRRVGKHIVFDLIASKAGKNKAGKNEGTGRQWIVHLGMTGRMLVATADTETAAHTHLVAKLHSGRELRFVDPRRFGRLEVSNTAFTGPGSEPLSIGLEDFGKLFHGRTAPIKGSLLNQKLLHGVGNIYAHESLFRAGVRPLRRSASLTREELAKLHRGLQQVLRRRLPLADRRFPITSTPTGRKVSFSSSTAPTDAKASPASSARPASRKLSWQDEGRTTVPNAKNRVVAASPFLEPCVASVFFFASVVFARRSPLLSLARLQWRHLCLKLAHAP